MAKGQGGVRGSNTIPQNKVISVEEGMRMVQKYTSAVERSESLIRTSSPDSDTIRRLKDFDDVDLLTFQEVAGRNLFTRGYNKSARAWLSAIRDEMKARKMIK